MSQRIPRDSLIGLKNCGNSCYFNSVIQMLFDIREFRQGIIRSNSSEIPIPQLRRIFTQLQELEVSEPYQKNYDITNLRKMKKLNQNLFLQNRSKILDVSKFMDLLNPWFKSCKLRPQTEFPTTQEDAAEFMQKCILNRFAGTPLIDPLEVVTRLRYDYINFGSSRNKAELDAIPIIQLNVYYYKENEKISTLIENFFNIHHTQPNSETSKNFWERKVLQNNPNYMIFSFDRTSFTDNKIDRNIILEDSIPIGGEQYNLYSVVVHKGTTMNEGHYMYLFKENNTSWILFNDSQVSRISNDNFLTKAQKNVAIVCYKKASQDIRIPSVENVRKLLPEIARTEAEAKAKAEAEEIAKAKEKAEAELETMKKEVKNKLKFFIGKRVYNSKLIQYTIADIKISNKGKFLGVRLRDENGFVHPTEDENAFLKYDKLIIPSDTFSEYERKIFTQYKQDTQELIIKPQGEIKGGARKRSRTRKVDARKRKRTRKT